MKRRASGWTFRIKQEADSLGSAFFITLTYANAPMKYEIPTPKRKTDLEPMQQEIRRQNKRKAKKTKQPTLYQPTILPTVDIKHLQKFIKRVRKTNASKKIRYYGVSEYGDQTNRPHYHIIILGLDIVSFIGLENWKLHVKGLLQFDGKMQIKVPTWKYGHITIGKCTTQSVQYTLKYISKGRKIPQFARDNRQKEKSLMSKNLGLSYLTDQQIIYHRQNKMAQYLVTDESKKIPMPRYYKDKLFTEGERHVLTDKMIRLQREKDLKLTPDQDKKRRNQLLDKTIQHEATKRQKPKKPGKI